jgi:hypothetical protein
MRRECFDHMLIWNEGHLRNVLDEYSAFYNAARPHQDIGQRRPSASNEPPQRAARVISRPILDGLHHDYQAAA